MVSHRLFNNNRKRLSGAWPSVAGTASVRRSEQDAPMRTKSVRFGDVHQLHPSERQQSAAVATEESSVDDDDSNDTSLEDDDDKLMAQLGLNQHAEMDSETVFPPKNSHVATLNRELKQLEVRYFRTRLQLEKTSDQNDQMRQEMKKMRAASAKTEKEMAKLRNLIDHIQAEKRQLEQQAIQNRDYAKKIEQRFFMGTKGQTLVQRNIELNNRVKELETALKDKESECERRQHDVEDAQAKANILRRALETKFEELQLNGSLHNGILFELARLQDQANSMIQQLTQERRHSKALELQIARAQTKETELGEAIVLREGMVATLETDIVKLQEQLAALNNEKQTFAFEKATLLRFIQEQAETKFQLDARVKQLQDTRAAEATSWQQKLEQLMSDKSSLQEKMHDLQTALEHARQQIVADKTALAKADEQAIALQNQAHERYLELQEAQENLKHAQEDFIAAKGVCQDLQTQLDANNACIADLQRTVGHSEHTIAELKQDIKQKEADELALRAEMEGTLQELTELSRQRDDAAKAMNEAVTISASSLEEQQALATKVETQRRQLEQLKTSKNLLQNAMLEQLSALRKQLQLERIQRIEAESKLKQMCDTSWRQPSPSSKTTLGTHMLDEDRLEPLPPPSTPVATPPALPNVAQYLQATRSEACVSPSSSSSCSSVRSLEDEECKVSQKPARSPGSSPQQRASDVLGQTSLATGDEELSVSLLELAGESYLELPQSELRMSP